jgi:hypothetical protein
VSQPVRTIEAGLAVHLEHLNLCNLAMCPRVSQSRRHARSLGREHQCKDGLVMVEGRGWALNLGVELRFGQCNGGVWRTPEHYQIAVECTAQLRDPQQLEQRRRFRHRLKCGIQLFALAESTDMSNF